MTVDTKIPDAYFDWLEGAQKFFSTAHPLFSRLDMKPVLIGNGRVSVNATLIDLFEYGADNRRVHGGVLTIILDTVFGFSVFSKLRNFQSIATVNLKTDYISTASTGLKIRCSAQCYALCDNIAYVRGEILEIENDTLVASATGAFMIGSGGPDFKRLQPGADS